MVVNAVCDRRLGTAPPNAAPHAAGIRAVAACPPGDLLLILVGYILLAVAYSLATPILEVSDESTHVATTWAIAAGDGLPIMNPADPRRVLVPAQEAGQPPLAHLLDAAVTFWIHGPAPDQAMLLNPQANVGSPDRAPWNKNMFVHTNAEAFPWHGLALAVHVERFLSILWGAGAVAGVYTLARLALPNRSAAPAIAAGIVAFNPMFLFIAASADNDAPAAALCTCILALLAHVLRGRCSRRLALATGVLLGLAALTKLNAAAVGLPAALVMVWTGKRQRSLRLTGEYLALMAATAAAISGWWFIRNQLLYRDPLALNVFLQIVGRRQQPPSLGRLLQEMPGIWLSFWGVLGNFNILLPGASYVFVAILAAAATVGLLKGAVQRRSLRPNPALFLLGGWFALEAMLLLRWTDLTPASTGRLLFPAIGSVAVLLACGLTELAGRFSRTASAATVSLLVLNATMALPLAILPAYAQPAFVPPATLHPAQRVALRYGNLELIGVAIPTASATPGEIVAVTLDWQAIGPIHQDDVVSLQLLGPDGSLVTQADSLPGGGRVRTSHWPAGSAISDRVPLRIPLVGPSPSDDRLAVFVYPLGQPGNRVAATTYTGLAVAKPTIGGLAVTGVNPYVLLAQHRPDVLRLYIANGWNGQTQGQQIFDDWLRHGPDGGSPTTATAYVRAEGWTDSKALKLQPSS